MLFVNFDEVKDEIIKNLKKKSLIPCLGSGFTYECPAYNGKVPSGKSYKKYMIEQLFNADIIPENEREEFLEESFSEVSDIYKKEVDIGIQKKYLLNNFTKVELSEVKKKFLSLQWPYIYTLNIDDGIENNEDYTVVYSNRPVDETIFDDSRCVIKLHGDVHEILPYKDAQSEVFAKSQYNESIITNEQLLTRLSNDSNSNNLIFIGCSLDDETDLSIFLKSSSEFKNSRYYVTCTKPTRIQQNKLENYGFTHCILFNNFDEIYQQIFDAGVEAEKLSVDDLNDISTLENVKLDYSFEANKPFIFHGKGLVDKRKKKITIPYSLIQRESVKVVLKQIDKYPLQIITGRNFSGKTYSISDLATRIKDRNVFYFTSNERLTNEAFNSLLNNENSVIISDSSVLSKKQIETILNNFNLLNSKHISFVIAASFKDYDVFDIIKLYIIQEKIEENSVPIIELSNRFSQDELDILNPQLSAIGVGIYNSTTTIIDNVIEAAQRNSESHKFQNASPLFNDYKCVAALIILATKRKIYSKDANMYKLMPQLEAQCRYATPLIDVEETFSYEVSNCDNSPKKYVTYANQWLINHLTKYAENNANHETIIQAYKYIVEQIIIYYGKLDVWNSKKISAYKDFILFDNINSLFFSERNAYNGLKLIRKIYEELNELLSLDAQYMHQRAKCYIKTSRYIHSIDEKLDYLTKASRDTNVAKSILEERYNHSHNDKIQISIAHLCYTEALILCHKCKIKEYKNKDDNTNAILLLYDALCSQYNSYEYAHHDTFNYGNAIEEMIQKMVADKAIFNESSYNIMGPLIKATMKS